MNDSHSISSRRWLSLLVCVGALSLGTACENPNPLEPVPPIGEYPVWGSDFGKDKIETAGNSLLNQPQKPTEGTATEAATEGTGTEGPSAAMVEGRTTFLNNCARCHGPEGKGMEVAMIGRTANLQSPEILGKPDAALMQVIQRGKGNMPAFAGQLNDQQIGAVLQWLRAGTPK